MIQERNNDQNYWDEISGAGLDASVIDPNDTGGHKNRYIIHIRNMALLEYLSIMEKSSLILDFGSGTGNATRFINNEGVSCVGLDISKKLISIAKQERQSDNYILYDGESMPISNLSFNGVFSYVVFSYITDQPKLDSMIEQIQLTLKPKSSALFIEQTSRKEALVEEGLKRIRTTENYISSFEKNGFSIKKIISLRSGHFPLTYLVRYGLVAKKYFSLLARLERKYSSLSECFSSEYIEKAFYLEKR